AAAVRERRLAGQAAADRDAAEAARRGEQSQRRRAEDLLERQYVDRAVRLLDAGDFAGALPWVLGGLRLVEGGAAREEPHRARLAAALHYRPRATHVWFHARRLGGAGWSPDGRRVVTAGWDGVARVWDAATGLPVTPPLQHGREVMHVAFSPDGSRVV